MARDWYKQDDRPLTWGERIEFGLAILVVGAGYVSMVWGFING